MKSKNFATLVLYVSLVIGALTEFRNKVQGSSPDTSDNFFLLNSYTQYINHETQLKALISERARRHMIDYCSGTCSRTSKCDIDQKIYEI
jgi:hypothetical protein